jgi:hypothetical protein
MKIIDILRRKEEEKNVSSPFNNDFFKSDYLNKKYLSICIRLSQIY